MSIMNDTMLDLNTFVYDFESTTKTTSGLISDDTTRLVSFILLGVVSPLIAVIGVVGNIFTITVLTKHGFHKCSNILLASLAAMDLSFLVTYNSVPGYLYAIEGKGKFLYSEPVSVLLYVVYSVLVVVDYAMGFAALTMPMFITLERLIVVFYPLRCKTIITPFRTWLVVLGVAGFWFVAMTYTCFWYYFDYTFDPQLNRSVGVMKKSQLYYHDLPGIGLFEELFWNMKVPLIFTVCGCVAIMVKVKLISLTREKMTNRSSSTSKTTKTLLTVCCGYMLTCTVVTVPSYLPDEISGFSITNDSPTNTAKITYQLLNLWLELNSSWNFLVYIALNNNFRQTFKDIFDKCCCCSKRG